MISQSNVACPCCGNHDLQNIGTLPDSRWFAGKHLAYALPGGNLYRCHHCRLKFRYPVPDAGTYQKLYDNATIETWASDASRPDWDLIVNHVFDNLPQGGRVLDFGCYSGGLLFQLGSNYECHGIEINSAAALIAMERTHGCIWTSTDDIPGNLCFDVVIASDVIEHMTNPLDFIHNVTELLSDNGMLIITTGDAENCLWNRFGANWWYCFYPEHITFISEPWIKHLSQNAGLSVVRCEKFRYNRQGVIRQLFNRVFAHCYGLFPTIYLRVGGALKKVLGRPEMTSVAGNGVSTDHLFIVLTRKAQP